MNDWERAEAWHRQISDRYSESSYDNWFYFCKRTGHGDLKAARDFVDLVIKQRAERRNPILEEAAGCFYWLDGRTEQAKAVLSKAYNRGSLVAAFCLAMIADDAKDASRRDQILKDLIARCKQSAPKLVAICQMLLDTVLDPGGKKPLDQAALDRLIEANELRRDISEWVVGWFLKNHGQVETARTLLERAANSPNLWDGFRALADDAIKRLGRKG